MSLLGSPNQRASLSLRERHSGSGLSQEKGTPPRGSSSRKLPSFVQCQPAALADSRDDGTRRSVAVTLTSTTYVRLRRQGRVHRLQRLRNDRQRRVDGQRS